MTEERMDEITDLIDNARCECEYEVEDEDAEFSDSSARPGDVVYWISGTVTMKLKGVTKDEFSEYLGFDGVDTVVEHMESFAVGKDVDQTEELDYAIEDGILVVNYKYSAGCE